MMRMFNELAAGPRTDPHPKREGVDKHAEAMTCQSRVKSPPQHRTEDHILPSAQLRHHECPCGVEQGGSADVQALCLPSNVGCQATLESLLVLTLPATV